MFVDVHAHDCNNVSKNILVVNNGLDLESNKRCLELKNKNIRCAMGLYPLEGIKLNEDGIDENIDFIKLHRNDIIAIGEIGLDFKFNKDKRQIDIFNKMLELAEEIKKPVIVHSRGAEKEVLDVLKRFDLNVIMHCFSGDLNLINKKYYYSIPVSVVERKWVQELARKVDVSRILTESDSPYVIFKKRKSKPEDVKEALKKISEIKEINLEKTKSTIFANYNLILHE